MPPTAKTTRASAAAAVAALSDEPAVDERIEPIEEAIPQPLSVSLSEDEIASAREEARKQWAARQKKLARAKVIELELQELERSQGSVQLGGDLDEIVMVRLHLIGPAGGGTGGPFDGAIIDGRKYQNGEIVQGPRHFINGLLEMMWRSEVAQHNLDGKSREEFYQRQRPVEVTKGGARVTQEQVMVA